MKKASMNHAYRLVWNDTLGCYVAVAETTKSRGKRASAALLASALLCAGGQALALDPASLPSGAQVVAGQALIQQNAAQMSVQQQGQKLILNWQSFDIGSKAGLKFEQPNANAVVLNRVLGSSGSQIEGSLTANGQVWLVNPNGVVFGQGAQVNVGGLVASSLAISDADFLAGRASFGGQGGQGGASGSAGAVRNAGQIHAEHGVVALLAPLVENSGSIQGAQVALGAGAKVALDFGSGGLLQLQVEQAALDASIGNSGHISGQQVILSARSAQALRASVINQDGVIEATGLQGQGGRIWLDGGGQGEVHIGGRLDASSAGGQGGRIDITGQHLQLDGSAHLNASGASGGGQIHVGGGWQGQDAGLTNAQTLRVEAGATAEASAGRQGNGGEVVFWSDGQTDFAGRIAVRGGAAGGAGGRAEVSGKQTLHYSGRTDARAPLGRTGDLLLDPSSITVLGGSGTGDVSGSQVYEKDLEAQSANVLLNASGHIQFADLNGNGGDGSISLQPDISLRIETGATNGNISFANKDNSIEVFGRGSIMMVAGGTGTGNIINVPKLYAHGAGSNPASLPTHDVNQVGNGTPGDASITLFGADGVTVGGSLTTAGGYVRIWADSDNASGGGFTLGAPINTGGGNLHISAGHGEVLLNSDMNLGAGRLLFRSDGNYSDGVKVLGGSIRANGDVNIDTSFTMKGGASIYTNGDILFGSVGIKLDTGTGTLTLRANKIDWGNATLQNLSTASLRLEPWDAATNMVLGDTNGFASAATLAKLPGIKNLTIGREDGTGSISVPGNFGFSASGHFEMVNRTVDISAGTLSNSSGNITLTGDQININQAVTANGGAGKVTIRQSTAANALHLGSGLSSASIGQVNAATLEVGRSDGGDLVFDSDISTSASTVHLKSGQHVVATAGGVQAGQIAVSAGAGAELSASAFNFSNLALDVGGATNITRTDNAAWGLGTVDGVSGLNVRAGSNVAVTLSAGGALSVNAPLHLNGNTSTLNLRSTQGFDASGATLSGHQQTTVEFELAGADRQFSLGGNAAVLSAPSLAKLDGIKLLRINAADDAVLGEAFSMAVQDRIEILGKTVALNGDIAARSGSLHLQALSGGLLLDHQLSAADTVSLRADGSAAINGNGQISAARLALRAGAVQLDGSSHHVSEIAADVAELKLSTERSLTVGTADGLSGVQAVRSVDLRALGAASDMVLNQAVQAGQDVLLQAGRNFVNQAGATALHSDAGHWRVYSTSPDADSRDGLVSDFKQYDAGLTASAAVLGSGNGYLYSVAPQISVTLTGSTAKVFDGNTQATLTADNYLSSGAIDGDSVAYSVTGNAQYDSRHAGSGKTVAVDGLVISGASKGTQAVYGYRLANGSASAAIGTITPKQVQAAAGSVQDKVYDGSSQATLSGTPTLSGVLAGDAVQLNETSQGSGSASFADKNVGSAKPVSISGLSLTGTDAGNYRFDGQATAAITPRSLSVSASVADKVYDGNTLATLTGTSLQGLLAGDQVGVSATAAFADKNAGNAKPVLISAELSGSDAANYSVDAGASSAQASITPKTLAMGGLTVHSKVYDGQRDAQVSGGALQGLLAGDSVGSQLGGQFDSKQAGNGKAVEVTIKLNGTDAGNYRLAHDSAQAQADIRPKTLDIGDLTVQSKVYDGKRGAEVGGGALQGLLAGDSVDTQLSGQFDNKQAGNAKAVDVTVQLTGADAGNYRLAAGNRKAQGEITPKTVSAAAAQVLDKVYDGRPDTGVRAPALSSINGILAGEQVQLDATAAFDNGAVGLLKPARVHLHLSGADAANYRLAEAQQQAQASITPALNDAVSASLVVKPLSSNGTQGSVDAGAGAGAAAGTQSAGGQTGPLVDNSGVANGVAGVEGNAGELLLRNGGQVSLTQDGAPLGKALESLLPVYQDIAADEALRPLAQYIVSDSGDSLALLPHSGPQAQQTSLSLTVSQRAETQLDLGGGQQATLRLELLSDGTLRAWAPDKAAHLGSETLSAYGLAALKQQTGVAAHQVRAVVLRFVTML
ncbi:MAG: filamentous hemagglutinin N-terminal domain-containing protein [Paucibacter sp.]|nr:filamentous hemagglutinin N-terminal domain-containing protein [Roseateles sp.]